MSYSIRAILILDSDGNRLIGKYYSKDFIAKEQKELKAFDTKLFAKTQGVNSEIILLDDVTIVYKSVSDLYFYVIGSNTENELLLLSVLEALLDALASLLRAGVDKRAMMENLDLTLLTLDELVDEGIIFESDPQELVSRVTMRGQAPESLPLSDQTIGQAIETARAQLTRTLLK